jgi:hypothetical protein
MLTIVEQDHQLVSMGLVQYTPRLVAVIVRGLLQLLDKLTAIKYCHGCYEVDSMGLYRDGDDDYRVVLTYYGGCSFEYGGRRMLSMLASCSTHIIHAGGDEVKLSRRHKYYTDLVTAYDFSMLFSALMQLQSFATVVNNNKTLSAINQLVEGRGYSNLLSKVHKGLKSVDKCIR